MQVPLTINDFLDRAVKVYPDRVAVFLVEIEQVEAGNDLSEPVAAAMVELADLVRAEIGAVVR